MRDVGVGDQAGKGQAGRLGVNRAGQPHHLFERLVQQAMVHWGISHTAARIIAGHIERLLIQSAPDEISRDEIVAMLEQQIAAFGLVLACPLQEAGWPA